MELVDKNGLTEEEYLKNYRPGDYERPSVTVDMLIFAVDNREESIRLLLIKRKNHPFLGCWALPGGFVEITESLRDAAARELEEETGVKGMYLEQLYTFGETGRDPRSRIISVAYMAVIDGSGLKSPFRGKIICRRDPDPGCPPCMLLCTAAWSGWDD